MAVTHKTHLCLFYNGATNQFFTFTQPALASVCRQARMEVLPVYYQVNTFRIYAKYCHHWDKLLGWMAAIGDDQVHAIKCLEIVPSGVSGPYLQLRFDPEQGLETAVTQDEHGKASFKLMMVLSELEMFIHMSWTFPKRLRGFVYDDYAELGSMIWEAMSVHNYRWQKNWP
jgi:hypothetical protein